MRVLVCGGRDYKDWRHAYAELDKLHADIAIKTVVVGGAMGADSLGCDWALSRLIGVDRYPADWKRLGRAAGPIRNQQMLDEGRPDLVIAFPGGRGTADMVRRAKAAGVKVIEVASAS